MLAFHRKNKGDIMINYEENRMKKIIEMVSIIKLLALFLACISVFDIVYLKDIFSVSFGIENAEQGSLFFIIPSMLFLIYQFWKYTANIRTKIEKTIFVDIFEIMILTILFSYLVYSTQDFQQYKFLYFFLILTVTIQFGMKWGFRISGFYIAVILGIDLNRTVAGEVNYLFQADFFLAGIFLVTTWLIGQYIEIENQHREKMLELINIDELTGIYNHRFFQDYLNIKIEDTTKNKGTLSLLFIDIDNFKHYNDMYGHSSGDEVLRGMGKTFQNMVSDSGIAARYGGEEFVVVLPDVVGKEAVKIGEKIRKSVEEVHFMGEEHQPGGKLTISVGVSNYPENAVNKKELIEMADDALYRAKSFSRNRVEVYFSVLEELKKDIEEKHVDLISSIKTLIGIINAKDKYTYGHTERVVVYCSKFANFLRLSSEEEKLLRYGAYLHDIGKIEIPAEVLVKRSKLTEDEFQALRKHPENGANIVEGVETLKDVVPIIKLHHEKYDGTGYPYKLKGEDIPYLVRIITLIDSFDAMTTNRSYCRGKTYEEAIEEIHRCKGTHFDPEIVESFIEMLEKDRKI